LELWPLKLQAILVYLLTILLSQVVEVVEIIITLAVVVQVGFALL
jgi:hypothetical protein